MPWFRSRPKLVEAHQFKLADPLAVAGVKRGAASNTFYVVTVHNQLVYLEDGDWILPEPDGEHYYPVKAAIFRDKYEPVEAAQARDNERRDYAMLNRAQVRQVTGSDIVITGEIPPGGNATFRPSAPQPLRSCWRCHSEILDDAAGCCLVCQASLQEPTLPGDELEYCGECGSEDVCQTVYKGRDTERRLCRVCAAFMPVASFDAKQANKNRAVATNLILKEVRMIRGMLEKELHRCP